MTVDTKRFERSPCYLCSYNGHGYYQPEQHPCAARYHEARSIEMCQRLAAAAARHERGEQDVLTRAEELLKERQDKLNHGPGYEAAALNSQLAKLVPDLVSEIKRLRGSNARADLPPGQRRTQVARRKQATRRR
jgi:hypothetical protein